MKLNYYLTIAVLMLFSVASHGQTSNSDDPMYQQAAKPGKPAATAKAALGGGVTVTGTTTATCDTGSTTLDVSGACSYEWYSDSAGTNLLASNASLTTPTLSNDSTFYLHAQCASSAGMPVPLPAHGSVFTGNVRGYWFQAPSSFFITGVSVGYDASSSATAEMAILKFNSGPPPAWSGTTNDFVVEGYWTGVNPDTINTCISVTAGDWIGVLGSRGDANSYAGAPYTSTIDGNAVTLTRLGMQAPLSTTAPSNVFSEASGSLSRVQLFTATTLDSNAVIPVNVHVPVNATYTVSTDICQGDSILLNGQYESVAGMYNDSLTTAVAGCDSIRITTLSVNASYDYQRNIGLCDGDSIEIDGTYYSSTTIFPYTGQTVLGCDSNVVNIIAVNSNPAVTFSPFSPDTVCQQGGLVPMVASPSGGTFTGSTGVSGTDFNPSTAGAGTYTLNYNYTDTNGCSGSASAMLVVVDCTGIDENALDGVTVFPNPTVGSFFINLPMGIVEQSVVRVMDASGKLVGEWNVNQNNFEVDLSSYSNGMYFVQVQANGKMANFKVTKS